jgi:curved DNA-binding protein CbpA
MTEQGPLPDPYAVLGISRRASSADIARAYRRLARELHPDSRPTDAGAADRLRAVMAAHELLSDPIRRAALDRQTADHPISPAEAPTPRIFATSPASQLHPLSRADAPHGVFPSPPSSAIWAGPARVQPLTRQGLSQDDAATARAELQLLQLVGYYLRHRSQWLW